MTRFQHYWLAVATRNSLSLETDVSVLLGIETVVFPVILRHFGAERGMVLVTDYLQVRPYRALLVQAGYGFSVLTEPTAALPACDDVGEMLKDWGWTGLGPAPTWLVETA